MGSVLRCLALFNYVLQLRTEAHDPEKHTAVAAGIADHIWTVEEIVALTQLTDPDDE